MSPNMSENKTNNTVTCDSCGHSARIHPQLADKYVQPMAEIFKVLGDPTRIKILELLSHEDMCVSNIAEMLDMTHSAYFSSAAAAASCSAGQVFQVRQRSHLFAGRRTRPDAVCPGAGSCQT